MTYALTDSISDLLEQPIPERSVNAMVHCPFHEDRTPSFSIHLEEGVWHCFSCGQGGTLKKLYRELGKGVDLNVRLYQAQRLAGSGYQRPTNFAAKANQFVRDARDSNEHYIRPIRSFLGPRGISEASARTYGLGYDWERKAIAFPYADLEGKVSGIKYRYRDGFKASESGSTYGLYGVNNVVGKGTIILCEGESDTLRLHTELGHLYGVGGTSGASVSATQWSRFGLHFLFAERIYLAYDADDAGDECAETAMSVLGDKCRRVRPTRGKDISDHLSAGGTVQEIGVEL